MLPLLVMFATLAGQQAAPTDPRPLQPLGTWVADSDYPASAIEREASGTVYFRLQVGPDGSPSACAVVQPVDPDLDATTCRIVMTRGHFSPARDERGTAIAGTYSGRIRWVLPAAADVATPFVPLRVAEVLRLDQNGNVICLVAANGAAQVQRPTAQCGYRPGSSAETALRSRGSPGDLILTYEMTPEGMTPAAGHEEAGGDLIYEESALLVIASDGTLSECRPERHSVRIALPLVFPATCRPIGARVMAPATNPEPRRAIVAVRAYLRGPTATPRP